MTARTDIGVQPIFTSPWPDPVVPAVSLPEFLLATAVEFADRPTIVDAVSGRTLRYGELADGVRRVADAIPTSPSGKTLRRLLAASGR